MDLETFQTVFQESILKKKENSRLENLICPGGSLKTQKEALEIHKTAYIVSLTEMLSEEYSCVWWVLGDDDFFKLCEDFVFQYPSKTYNLMFYGGEFPSFLKKSKYLNEAPYLYDLALFEKKNAELFHQKKYTPCSSEDIHRLIQDPSLPLCWTPSLKIFSSSFSIFSIWNHISHYKNEDLQKPYDFPIDQPEFILLYKIEDQVYAYNMKESMYSLLKQLLQSASIEEFIDSVGEGVQPEEIEKLFSLVVETELLIPPQ